MSCRHRHFSVRPARLANVTFDEIGPTGSRIDHGSDVAVTDVLAGQAPSALARAQFRSRRKSWIRDVGRVSASTPMWISRSAFLADVAVWVDTAAGREACKREHVTADLFARVAAACASFADSATGRHCAATNTKIAQLARCCARSVTTVRKILSEAGFAVEVYRGSGSRNTPTAGRRASVWHFLSRRQPVDNSPLCALPSPLDKDPSLQLGSNSPREPQSVSPRRKSTKPRPSASQHPRQVRNIASWMAGHFVGLTKSRPGQHVVGQLCIALSNSHLEMDLWTGPLLRDALDQQMKSAGGTWPNQIHSPGAFLAQRLRKLPARPPQSSVPHKPAVVSDSPVSAVVPGPASVARRSAMALCRQILKQPRQA